MGQYIPPEVAQKGRKVSGTNFQTLKSQLKPDELLFGLFDRGIFKQAPYLYSEAEFGEFDRLYRTGVILSATYYALRVQEAQSYGIAP